MKRRLPLVLGLAVCLAACGSPPKPKPTPPTDETPAVDALGSAQLFDDDCEAPPGIRAVVEGPSALRRTVSRPQGLLPATSRAGLDLYIFSIGQADSMLAVGPTGKTLLIDLGEVVGRKAGDPWNYPKVAARLRALTGGKTHLDYFLVSHMHSDHVGHAKSGVAGLVEKEGFTIGTFIDIQVEGAEFIPKPRGTFEALDKNVKKWLSKGLVTKREKPKFGSGQIDLGGKVQVEILAFAGRVASGDKGALAKVKASHPNQYTKKAASENDLSIALEISVGDFEFFTSGDLSGAERPWRLFESHSHSTYTNVERHLVRHWRKTGRESDVEIYRVSHHGSQYSTIPQFLTALDPEFVLYSTGGDYGHPSKPVVTRCADTARQLLTTKAASHWTKSELSTLRAEVVGEIHIRVDSEGQWYTIQGVEHKAYTDAEEKADADVDEEETEWVD